MTNAEYPDGGTPGPVHTHTTQPSSMPNTGSNAGIGAEFGGGLLAIVAGCVVLFLVARGGKKR